MTYLTSRNILFLIISLIVGIIYYAPLYDLLILSLYKSELYSHIVIIPLVSAYFIYIKRKEIFSGEGYSYIAGIVIIILGSLLYLGGLTQTDTLNQNDYLSFLIFSAVITWFGVVIFFYGVKTFKNARFPLLFLIFLIPIPSMVIEHFIDVLQYCSTEVANVLFKLSGVPFLRNEFTFQLPGIAIEVAKECSGIRSSISLFITSIIAGQLFLDTGWRKVALTLAIFPITIFKNGLRIVTLAILGSYVDPGILDTDVHKKGGIPFFFLSLMVLGVILWFLRRSEVQSSRN